MVQLPHPYMTTGKTKTLTRQTFVGKVMSLCFNMLSRFTIAFLPRSKCLLISWLQSPSAVILEPKKIKPVSFHFFLFFLPWSDGTGSHDLSLFNVEFQARLFSVLFHHLQRWSSSLVPIHFLPLEWYHLHIWCCWYFSQRSWFQLASHTGWHFKWCTLHRS